MVRFDGPAQFLSFVRRNRRLVTGARYPRTVPQVGLGADEDRRSSRTEVADLWNPLESDVVEAVAVLDGEADDDDVGVGVRQWTQLLVVFLAGRVPQRKLNCLTVDLATTYIHDFH